MHICIYSNLFVCIYKNALCGYCAVQPLLISFNIMGGGWLVSSAFEFCGWTVCMCVSMAAFGVCEVCVDLLHMPVFK